MILVELDRPVDPDDGDCEQILKRLYPSWIIHPFHIEFEVMSNHSTACFKLEPLFHYAVIEKELSEDILALKLRGFKIANFPISYNEIERKYYSTPEGLGYAKSF